MPYYSVDIPIHAYLSIIVEADTPEAAEEVAFEEANLQDTDMHTEYILDDERNVFVMELPG